VKNEEADNEEEQTYWYVCEWCDEGYYSNSFIMSATCCDRCWKENGYSE